MTKDAVLQAVAAHDWDALRAALYPENPPRVLLSVLDGLGKLPPSFPASLLTGLLAHENATVRLNAADALGKVKDRAALALLCEVVFTEPGTLVRREMVSAIGRQRSADAIPTLTALLADNDPKVVLQALRGLLVFKARQEVREAIAPLMEHESELVRNAAIREVLDIVTDDITLPRRNARPDTPHAHSPDWLKNVLVNADTAQALPLVPDESVHLTFTSPPYYNARDYTLYRSYDEYLRFLAGVFREVHRVTKEGRFFILNTSPVIVPRMGRSHSSTRYLIPFDIHPLLTEMGWEFIDDIIWVKPEPSAKNRNGGFFQHRKPLGYKANSVCEYVIVYRKKTDKLLDWNIKQYPPDVMEASKVTGAYDKSNAWKIAPANNPVHSAVFPKELASRIIELYSYKGDLVLDPFGGRDTVRNAPAGAKQCPITQSWCASA